MIRSNSPASLRADEETSNLLGNAAFLIVLGFELLRIACLFVGFLPGQLALMGHAGELSSLSNGMVQAANDVLVGRAVAEITWFIGLLTVMVCLNEWGDRWVWSRIVLSALILIYAVMGFFEADAYRVWLEYGLRISDRSFVELLDRLGTPPFRIPGWAKGIVLFFAGLIAIRSIRRAWRLREAYALLRRGSPWQSKAL